MAGASDKQKIADYNKGWNYNVRTIFFAITPKNGKLTDDQIDKYVKQLIAIDNDIRTVKPEKLTDKLLKQRVDKLIKDYENSGDIQIPGGINFVPSEKRVQDLTEIFRDENMPTTKQIEDSRKRVGSSKDDKPKGRPQIAKPVPPTGPFEPNNNIALADNPPTIYDAIKEGDIRRINAEIKDSSFDPDQTFQVTISPPGGAANIETQLTPLQYAALAGLKGYVRLLLKAKGDLTKKINGLSIRDAVEQYRVKDEDKTYVKFVFEIADTAFKDATDDYSSGAKLDTKYGEGMKDDVDKALAKLIYEREYKELDNPTIPKTPKKTTTGLVDEAKRRGKEDAEKGLERSAEYLTAKPEIEKNAYQAEYTKYIVEKDKKKGKTDGESGSPRDVSYDTKTPEEKEAYGKEYDKAFAAYQGEKDALVNQPPNYTGIETSLSQYYQTTTNDFYKTSVKKIYDDAYEKNRSKTSDLVKQAGYVGTYPPSETLLSGNFFGFGSDLNKIIGFDTSDSTPKTDTDAKYKEGLVEFVNNLQSIIGQAKYAGYTDGRKRNAKYTTPGKISVGGKEYAIDFGKLNTQLKELPGLDGPLQETIDFADANRLLNRLKSIRDSAETLEDMVTFLRNQSESHPNDKIKQILKTIAVSQRGGVINPIRKNILRRKIEEVNDQDIKTTLLNRFNQELTDDQFQQLETEVNSELNPLTRAQQRQRWLEAASNIQPQLQPQEQEAAAPEAAAPEAAAPEAAASEAAAPEEPSILSRTLARTKDFGTSVATGATTGLQAIGTAATTGVQTIASAPSAFGKFVVTGLGTVSTKTELYNIVQKAFSSIPKYVTTQLKPLPTGISPDDPEIKSDVHPIKRVQAMYDKEFERGYKEAMRPVGGTRRKSKKSNRITKKKVSKK